MLDGCLEDTVASISCLLARRMSSERRGERITPPGRRENAQQTFATTLKAAEADVMRERFAFSPNLAIRFNTALSLRPLCVFRTCMRRPGYFPGA